MFDIFMFYFRIEVSSYVSSKKSGISNYAYNLNVSMNGKLMIYLS